MVVLPLAGAFGWARRGHPRVGGIARRLTATSIVFFPIALGMFIASSIWRDERLVVLGASCDDRRIYLEDISPQCGSLSGTDLVVCTTRIEHASAKADANSVRSYRRGEDRHCSASALAALKGRRVVVTIDGIGNLVNLRAE